MTKDEDKEKEDKVWNIRSKMLGGNICKERLPRIIPLCWFVIFLVLIAVAVVVPVVMVMKNSQTPTQTWVIYVCIAFLALIACVAAFLEWRGDVLKEAIDRVPDYSKDINGKGLIAHEREVALLAKAIKFIAAFATVLVGLLTKLQ